MGTPLPPITIEPGDPCNECWGDAGPFSLPTPLTVFMTLHDWSEGNLFDEALRSQLEGTAELTQSPTAPCLWVGTTANLFWILEYAVGLSLMQVGPLPPFFGGLFDKIAAPACQETLPNSEIDPIDNIIFGGTASVYFGSPP